MIKLSGDERTGKKESHGESELLRGFIILTLLLLILWSLNEKWLVG
jgi:hypothetical protein